MNRVFRNHLVIFIAFTTLAGPSAIADEPSPLYFDLPSTVAALADRDDPNLVTVDLCLSSMIASPTAPRIDQWLVRVVPRDPSISIADYAPRTATASEVTSPIQVKRVEEETDTIGVSVVGAYGHLGEGNAGVDRTNRNSSTVQYDRIAPEQAVTASGTIHRGKGVYFKLRWTARQILEGDKTFRVTMRVGSKWRAGLIDVSVIAQSEPASSFVPWDREPKTIGGAHFVVAAFRHSDLQAETMAHEVAEAEHALRRLAANYEKDTAVDTLRSMLRRVATRLDPESRQTSLHWVSRLLLDRADPHVDKEIKKLPMPIRVAVLDYIDRRDEFATINDSRDDALARRVAL